MVRTWITFAALPHHPMYPGQDSSARHQTLKNRIFLENYYLPGDLEAAIDAFVAHYNHLRYYERLLRTRPNNPRSDYAQWTATAFVRRLASLKLFQ